MGEGAQQMKPNNKKAIELIERFFLSDNVHENIAWLKATVDAAEFVADSSVKDKTYNHILFCIRGFAEIVGTVEDMKNTKTVEA